MHFHIDGFYKTMRPLWYLNFYCRIHNGPLLHTILSQLNPVLTLSQLFVRLILVLYSRTCVHLVVTRVSSQVSQQNLCVYFLPFSWCSICRSFVWTLA